MSFEQLQIDGFLQRFDGPRVRIEHSVGHEYVGPILPETRVPCRHVQGTALTMSACCTCALIFAATVRLRTGSLSWKFSKVVGASCSKRFNKLLWSPLQYVGVEMIWERLHHNRWPAGAWMHVGDHV
jgi:hypothetical protein